VFTKEEIADYYNQTLDHYKIWWNLSETQSVHYGIWHPDTPNFNEALWNTNREMAALADIKPGQHVLDAGCGVGGSSLFLAQQFNCQVKGITLSTKQSAIALQEIAKLKLEGQIDISIQDYTQTNFADESFDVVWACESSCYAKPKTSFLQEAFRLLKPGGTLVVADYFLTESGIQDKNQFIRNWGDTWAIEEFNTAENFIEPLDKLGFRLSNKVDFTQHITPSSRRMYRSFLIGAIPSILYNATHHTSRFAKRHYLSGKFQYQALKQKQWDYFILVAIKK
jgi:cyclopropane fatty-acyl-phospholipid synthase-like methyltransferase